MNAKNPKFAIPPKGEYASVKAGEKYKVLNFDDGFFNIVSPKTGQILLCLSDGCAHLDGKKWILRNK